MVVEPIEKEAVVDPPSVGLPVIGASLLADGDDDDALRLGDGDGDADASLLVDGDAELPPLGDGDLFVNDFVYEKSGAYPAQTSIMTIWRHASDRESPSTAWGKRSHRVSWCHRQHSTSICEGMTAGDEGDGRPKGNASRKELVALLIKIEFRRVTMTLRATFTAWIDSTVGVCTVDTDEVSTVTRSTTDPNGMMESPAPRERRCPSSQRTVDDVTLSVRFCKAIDGEYADDVDGEPAARVTLIAARLEHVMEQDTATTATLITDSDAEPISSRRMDSESVMTPSRPVHRSKTFTTAPHDCRISSDPLTDDPFRPTTFTLTLETSTAAET